MTPPPAAAVAARRGLVERPHRPPAPTRPRRVSGPARSPAKERSGARARPSQRRAAGLGGALVLAAAGVCEHRLLDRVVRGRVWIGLVTFALLGIVTLQLALLELNGSIGRTLARKAQLLRQTSALSIENSSLASGEHVMSAATAAGMVPVTISGLRFLDAHGANPAHAAAALRAHVQQPPREAPSSGNSAPSEAPSAASSSSSEASQGSESSSENLSSSSSSSSSESSGGSEGTQSETGASHGSEAEPAASEAGGSSAGGGG